MKTLITVHVPSDTCPTRERIAHTARTDEVIEVVLLVKLYREIQYDTHIEMRILKHKTTRFNTDISPIEVQHAISIEALRNGS